MLSTLESPTDTAGRAMVLQDVASACGRIPPLWDLSNYVAVNPFLGFADQPVGQAANIVEGGLGARLLPSLDYYRGKWEEGALSAQHLSAAARRHGTSLESLQSFLSSEGQSVARQRRKVVLTLGECHDLTQGDGLDQQSLRGIARWCAVYASSRNAGTNGNEVNGGFYRFWRASAGVDRSLEILGVRSWRNWVRQLPDSADDAILAMTERLGLDASDRVEYFYRLLGRLYGWASWFRRSTWQNSSGETGDVRDLLAVLLCAEAGLAQEASSQPSLVFARESEDEVTRVVLQDAIEDAYANRLIASLNPPAGEAPATRAAVQAVFCIDVRSEPMRRHLEVQSALIETRGFAGFFGVCLDWQNGATQSARCPVLLKPSLTLRNIDATAPTVASRAAQSAQSAPAAAFSFVELFGLGYGVKLAADTLAARDQVSDSDRSASFDLRTEADDATRRARIELAAGILKNMGLRDRFGRIVLLCGHAGHSANNPHAAGLDCGACGGHGGAINARVVAALLNESAVRAGLVDRGFVIPADTHFLPAVHDTGTDDVSLLDLGNLPATHRDDAAQLQVWLERAGEQVRAERAPALGLGDAAPGFLDRLLRRRSRDWSEVRPEWGLARNAAFIAAQRARSRGVDLRGRAFLHEYDASTDVDSSVLTLILSAPMVVASWINLQYFASTVDNDVFGAGNKVLHNRVGNIGVVLGNGGDLRTGLASQSVHSADGSWYHEPLRLQVIVEAPRERVEAILKAQQVVWNLVNNGWVRLMVLDPNGTTAVRWACDGWEPITAEDLTPNNLEHPTL